MKYIKLFEKRDYGKYKFNNKTWSSFEKDMDHICDILNDSCDLKFQTYFRDFKYGYDSSWDINTIEFISGSYTKDGISDTEKLMGEFKKLVDSGSLEEVIDRMLDFEFSLFVNTKSNHKLAIIFKRNTSFKDNNPV